MSNTEMDLDEEIIESKLEEWLDRSKKIRKIIMEIEDWRKKVANPYKIIAHLSLIVLTLDLAMEGDENAIEVLRIESETMKKSK